MRASGLQCAHSVLLSRCARICCSQCQWKDGPLFLCWLAAGQWAGPVGAAAQAAPSQPAPGHLPLAPDFGPLEASPRWGVCCVGASPWIVNFNVLLSGVEFEAARGLARSVSERGGGLKGVQAMALRHAEGGVACFLEGKEGPGTCACCQPRLWGMVEVLQVRRCGMAGISACSFPFRAFASCIYPWSPVVEPVWSLPAVA